MAAGKDEQKPNRTMQGCIARGGSTQLLVKQNRNELNGYIKRDFD
jgi:hypothetical protein